jgi:hypothetical protein
MGTPYNNIDTRLEAALAEVITEANSGSLGLEGNVVIRTGLDENTTEENHIVCHVDAAEENVSLSGIWNVNCAVTVNSNMSEDVTAYSSDLLTSHNGNAEAWTGSTPTGWTGTQYTPSGATDSTSVNHTQETTIKHGGSNALRLHTTHFLAETLYAGPIGTFTLTEGKTYKFSAWVRNTKTRPVQLNIYSSAGIQLAYVNATPSINTWTELTGTYTANHLASAYGEIGLVIKALTDNGEYLYVDDFTIVESSSAFINHKANTGKIRDLFMDDALAATLTATDANIIVSGVTGYRVTNEIQDRFAVGSISFGVIASGV